MLTSHAHARFATFTHPRTAGRLGFRRHAGRRLGLPSILGYVTVGLVLGPHALGLFPESDTAHLLAELGVVFLLFTLGLEFSWPRMVALRREVFGLGALQVFGTAGVVALIAHLFGLQWAQSIVIGGVVAMSSTVLIVQQLTERAELNRTHGRLAFSVVLFQDIAVVPFLALAAALAPGGEEFSYAGVAQPGRPPEPWPCWSCWRRAAGCCGRCST